MYILRDRITRALKPRMAFGLFLGFAFITGLFFSVEGRSCTIVVSTNEHTILVGNNEDYIEPRTGV